jgi:hypothetical protein
MEELRAAKDQAYSERNRVLQLLTKVVPAHLRRHEPANDPDWDPQWRWVVCVHPPFGPQMTWHIHERELSWFDHLIRHPNPGRVMIFDRAGAIRHGIFTVCEGWDGHTTEEKHSRIHYYPPVFRLRD